MRYLRVEECAECKGEKVRINREFKPYECPTCVGEGETHTPVEHTELWALIFKSIPTRLGTDPAAIWSQVVHAGLDVKILKAAGYTCEQVDVIRREP